MLVINGNIKIVAKNNVVKKQLKKICSISDLVDENILRFSIVESGQVEKIIYKMQTLLNDSDDKLLINCIIHVHEKKERVIAGKLIVTHDSFKKELHYIKDFPNIDSYDQTTAYTQAVDHYMDKINKLIEC